MAVVDVRKIHGEGGSWTVTDSGGDREYSETYLVIVNNPADDAVTVSLASGIPQLYTATYIGDAGARCRKVTPKRRSNTFLQWEIDVEYSDKVDPETENPISKPAEVSFGFEQYQKPVIQDIEGKPFMNSAGDRFPEPFDMDDSRPVLTVTKNVPVFDANVALAYQDAVNSDLFTVSVPGFSMFATPGLAKIQQFSGVSQFENDVFFWKRTIEIHFRREGWRLRPLDEGYHRLQSGDDIFTGADDLTARPKLRKIVIHDGTEPKAPVKLNGSGQPISNTTDAGLAVFLNYQVYKELPFSALSVL